MSGAAARTDLAYSSLIARLWQVEDYRYPNWPKNGLPLNLEALLRHLVKHFGHRITGLEWIALLGKIDEVLNPAETYYERGEGTKPDPSGTHFYHNTASAGFYVADAWQMNARMCKSALAKQPLKDHFLGVPEASFFRTAYRVLNPSQDPQYDDVAPLDWLDSLAEEQGVANTLVWLGSNNILGTMLRFSMNPSQAVEGMEFTAVPRSIRCGWDYWKPEHFEEDFSHLIARLENAMHRNKDPEGRVFIGTIPHVTIAPLVKGVGSKVRLDKRGWYYEYYTYFPFDAAFAKKSGIFLTMQRAIFLDDVIDIYNETLRRLVGQANARLRQRGLTEKFFLVDVSGALDEIAYRRNNGKPTYAFPHFFKQLDPPVNSLYYHANREGKIERGGLFSLDGVHPSPLLQGLIAHEFLLAMKAAGVTDAQTYPHEPLPWQQILATDRLYGEPIPLMSELYEHLRLAKVFVKWCHLMNWGRKTGDPWWI